MRQKLAPGCLQTSFVKISEHCQGPRSIIITIYTKSYNVCN